MTVINDEREQQTQRPTAAAAQVRLSHATWNLPPAVEHSSGAPREPGFGARLAVRKFSASLDKLADNQGSPLEYLQFEGAWLAIEAARLEAFATGVRVPPYRLDQCDRDRIESALYAPQTAMEGVEKYPDLPSKAAALLYAFAKSQACPDGNKRVALILVMEFLAINGSTLEVEPDPLADMIVEVATSEAALRDEVVEELTENLGRLIVPLTAEDA